MPDYDNKVLTGAGVAELSQLIKEEIAQSSGSGGTEYTAGSGIEISEDNEINKLALDEFLGAFIGYSHVGPTFDATYSKITPATKEEAITALRAGEIITGIDFTCQPEELVPHPVDPSSWLANEIGWIRPVSSSGQCQRGRFYGTDTITFSKDFVYILLGRTLIYWSDVGHLKAFFYRFYYNNSASGLAATAVSDAINELATTRIADSLVSEETTPTVNNTINWLYE